MTIIEIMRKAEEFDITATSALLARARYLKVLMKSAHETICAYAEYNGTDSNEAVARELAWHANDDFMQHAKELRNICRKISGIINENEITDEMIAIAKAHPIDKIIYFHKGAAIAWCHDDRNPSLTWDKKRNRAKCWPCDKSFDPISVLRERDGLSLQDAVRRLQ